MACCHLLHMDHAVVVIAQKNSIDLHLTVQRRGIVKELVAFTVQVAAGTKET